MGHTHIRLAAAKEEILTGALRTAWKSRVDKNRKKKPQKRGSTAGSEVAGKKRGRQ